MIWEKDLVVLGADDDWLAVVRTVFTERAASLGIKQLNIAPADFIKDVWHDSSPAANAVTLLRKFQKTHHRALVIRDLEGSGCEAEGAASLEETISQALVQSGWARERVCTIVIEPELEIWLRFQSSHLEQMLQTKSKDQKSSSQIIFAKKLAEIADKNGGMTEGKPSRPKEVFEGLLRTYRVPWSSSLFEHLAQKESLKTCVTPSFNRLLSVVRDWFEGN